MNEAADTFPPLLDAWYLTGPTASGKSGVGLELARQIGAEIVSLDSMALYQGMDLGTAKPSREDRERVPHHPRLPFVDAVHLLLEVVERTLPLVAGSRKRQLSDAPPLGSAKAK